MTLSYYLDLAETIHGLVQTAENEGAIIVVGDSLGQFMSHAEQKVLWGGIGSVMFAVMVVCLNWRATFRNYRKMVCLSSSSSPLYVLIAASSHLFRYLTCELEFILLRRTNIIPTTRFLWLVTSLRTNFQPFYSLLNNWLCRHNVAGFFLIVFVMNIFLLAINLLATVPKARDGFLNILKVSGSLFLIRMVGAYLYVCWNLTYWVDN